MGKNIQSSLIIKYFNMSKLILTILAYLSVVIVVVTAEPKYKKLERSSCSLIDVFACEGEIEDAWNQCSHAESIVDCIKAILGTSDCANCICDILGMLGLFTCPTF